MDDLISRQAAIDKLDPLFESLAIDKIKALPTAQPDVIRCKDCMHNGSFDTDCPINWNGKEYCSFAERRTDEQT